MNYESNIDFALQLDSKDPLKEFRRKFIIPKRDNKEQIYFLGNSLGLQPVNTRTEIDKVLEQWSAYGVEGFFYGTEPWMQLHDRLAGPLAMVVGAKSGELVVMNQLSVNLHLMMVSFYKPQGKRNKIICEAKAFPSDQYMLESHLKTLGLDPETIIIEIAPRDNEFAIREEDILKTIDHHREELALVFWGGINYYTGQLFDLQQITKATHAAGAIAGFDLAHAAGNVELKLHEWEVDFACWCSYKYLNSGPGAVGGVFINKRYHTDTGLMRYAGWWGYDKATRFKMQKGFIPVHTAEGWQLSTPSMLLYASHLAALEIFEEAGMKNILLKSALMSDYLLYLLNELRKQAGEDKLKIITPENPLQHGSQVSMMIRTNGRAVFESLGASGIFADWREPDVIRIAPVPLYNSFEELFRFSEALNKAFKSVT